MDLIQNVLDQKGGELLAALMRETSMDRTQAEAFLPGAGRAVLEAMTAAAPQLDHQKLQSTANVSRIVDQIDVGALASGAGVSALQGMSGLSTIVPMVLGFVGESKNAGTLLNLAARARTLGGSVGHVKGIGKLFG